MTANHATAPTRAILLTRLSELRAEDLDDNGRDAGLDDQTRRLRDGAALRGWTVAREVVENDVDASGKLKPASAFKRRKVTLPGGRTELRVYRPAFRSALEDLRTGRADALLAVDLDRVVRDPRDLEDLIDIARERKATIDSLTGSLRFTNGGTDAEITLARIMVSIANKSSMDTARRVAAARKRRAESGGSDGNGKTGNGGLRAFGFEPDRVTVRESEAEEIRRIAAALLSGVSLKACAAGLRERGVPSVTGARWSAETLRCVILKPINAGFVVYGGEIIGRLPGDYRPILEPEVFEALKGKLTAPERRSQRAKAGPAHSWLGTGLFTCPCGGTMEITEGAAKAARYRCRAKRLGGAAGVEHTSRNCAATDLWVEAQIVARLSEPDALDLVAPQRPGVDVAGLRRSERALQEKKAQLAEMLAAGDLDPDDFRAAKRRNDADLQRVREELAAVPESSPLAGLIGVEDVAAAWQAKTVGEKRAALAALCTVTILPSTKGAGFNPKCVAVDWMKPAARVG